jgi:phenylpyruvate tautomerase PptA (4-oxalocrotonate tautomerase family)
MPLYQINHVTPLSSAEKQSLASKITEIHSKMFNAPSLFVNVWFNSKHNDTDQFVAGKPCKSDSITVFVRTGALRPAADFNDLAKRLHDAWVGIVGGGQRELRGVFVIEGIVAAAEVGFLLPEAGKDTEWIAENWEVSSHSSKSISIFLRHSLAGEGDPVE